MRATPVIRHDDNRSGSADKKGVHGTPYQTEEQPHTLKKILWR
jgi:hypothetical protein